MLDVMPDRGLIEHQWDKHGTCTGLDQQRYADLTRQASESISMPALFSGATLARLDADAIEAAFADANPGLSQDAIAIICPGGRFAEVRLCLDTNLTPRACAQVDRNGCRQTNLPIAAR
jgi:ribonuclease T2